MGHSLSLLTAVLLVGQTPAINGDGRDCPCKNRQQGRVLAQPEYAPELRTVGWMNWRNSSTTQSWRGSTESTSWADNRPVLSRIRGWFKRNDDNSRSIRTENVQPGRSPPTIVEPATKTPDYYRRLPTTKDQPAGGAKTQPAVQPKPLAPIIRDRTPAEEKPLTIEVEPIQFRSAGNAKGIAPASTAAGAPLPTAVAVPPSRTNPISERFVNKVGQPGDYSWITGQLEIRGRTYIIHYATPETVDRYDGSLMLAADAKLLGNVRSGDLVSIHGNVVHQSGRNAYRVQSIDLIER